MSVSRMRLMAGAAALVVAAAAELAQYVVTPAHISGGEAADQIAAVGDQAGRMQLGLWLDLPILAIIPALLFLGELAGSRRSKLAATGTVLAFVGALTAGYLLANDVVLYSASQVRGDGAVDVLSAYEGSGVVGVAVIMGVLGVAIGQILLGIALVRARTVPLWVGIAVAAVPVLQVLGEGSGIEAVATAAYVVQLVAFGACALALLRSDRVGVAPPLMTTVAS